VSGSGLFFAVRLGSGLRLSGAAYCYGGNHLSPKPLGGTLLGTLSGTRKIRWTRSIALGKVGLKPQRPHHPQPLFGEEAVVPPLVGRLALRLPLRALRAFGPVVVGGEVDGLAQDRQYGEATYASSRRKLSGQAGS
jgi:hypothetical protein